jgi:hypothetical protein
MKGKQKKIDPFDFSNGFSFKDFVKEQDKIQEKINKTSSKKKLWSYLADLTKHSAFRKDLKDFRKKFCIDEKGYEKPIYIKMPVNGHKVLTYPNHVEVESQEGYRIELIKFARKYKLGPLWEDVLECYIFYNKFIINTMGSMIDVEDVCNYFYGPYMDFNEKDVLTDYITQKSQDFPVAIFLNPYVSQRDIIDYVKKTFKLEIEPLLKSYREDNVGLGKVRQKNSRVAKRNDFIYKNKNKPKKEITNLVSEKFGDILDYTYIARIIKEEERLRK